MNNMLNIAGGVVVGLGTLGILSLGIRMFLPSETRPFVGTGVRLTGFMLAIAAIAFVAWLLLVRTGYLVVNI
jgi:hypothetical protein